MLMFVALSTLLVAANAGLLPVQQTHLLQSAPIAYAHAPVAHTLHQLEEHSPAQYDFSYSVNDPHTGDVKEQHESRQGDNVQGQYSLVEPDGQRRTVQYTADAINGFNAVVSHDGLSQHATPVATTISHAALPTVTLAHRAAIATPVTTIAHHAIASPAIAYTPKYTAPLSVATPLTTTYHAPQPQLAAPIAYTQKYATPLATTTYHAAQPQIAYAQHAAPIAYAQHPAPAAIAYAQHHISAAPAALAYTQHQLAAPAVAYHSAAPAVATTSVTHHGSGLSYSY